MLPCKHTFTTLFWNYPNVGQHLVYIFQSNPLATCVVEDCVFEGAVLKEGVGWPDVLKVTVLKKGILKLHRLNLNVSKPSSNKWDDKKKKKNSW